MGNLSETSRKNIMGATYVDVCHFFHGDMTNRSYGQRDFMISVFYPWMNKYIYDDEKGLLSWLDFSNPMFKVISNLHLVRNKKENANELMKGLIDYTSFYDHIRKDIYNFSN